MTRHTPLRGAGGGTENGMNTVRIGVITLCVAAGASGYWWLRGAATDDVSLAQVTRGQATRAQVQPMAASGRYAIRNSEHAANARPLDRVVAPEFEADAPELLAPSKTPNQVLDAVNADI